MVVWSSTLHRFRTGISNTGRYPDSNPIGPWDGLNMCEYLRSNPFICIDLYGLWALGIPLPQGLVDGATGFADGLSGGLTVPFRDRAGIGGGANYAHRPAAWSRAEAGHSNLSMRKRLAWENGAVPGPRLALCGLSGSFMEGSERYG